jgi:hypothetical protein
MLKILVGVTPSISIHAGSLPHNLKLGNVAAGNVRPAPGVPMGATASRLPQTQENAA